MAGRNPFKYINLPDRSPVLPYTIQLLQKGVWRDVARHSTSGKAFKHFYKLVSLSPKRFRAVCAERPGKPLVFAGPGREDSESGN